MKDTRSSRELWVRSFMQSCDTISERRISSSVIPVVNKEPNRKSESAAAAAAAAERSDYRVASSAAQPTQVDAEAG